MTRKTTRGIEHGSAQVDSTPAPRGCLDRKEAANYLSISTRLLDSYCTEGKLRRVKFGRKTCIPIPDLDALIESKIQRLEVEN